MVLVARIYMFVHVAITFGVFPETGRTRLLSLGADRVLVSEKEHEKLKREKMGERKKRKLR